MNSIIYVGMEATPQITHSAVFLRIRIECLRLRRLNRITSIS